MEENKLNVRNGCMIKFNVPPYTGMEINYIKEAIDNQKICGDGVFTCKCNQWLEERFGTSKALLTTSCTHALEMAALLTDINPGDEVIMPSFTFVSTADAFVLRGAKIIFVDIRPDTMNIDENLIETQKVEYGHFAVQPTSINNLKGWSVNGFDIIDVTTYEITENTIFLAILYENITLFSGEKEVVNVENAYSENICNAEYNLNFDNLLTTDKIIVTFSVVGIFIGPDQAEPTYYWNGEGFSLSSSSVGDLIVNSEENFFVENLYYVNGAYIKINCLNNGILTIQTSGGYVDCGFTKLTISKIEILR